MRVARSGNTTPKMVPPEGGCGPAGRGNVAAARIDPLLKFNNRLAHVDDADRVASLELGSAQAGVGFWEVMLRVARQLLVEAVGMKRRPKLRG